MMPGASSHRARAGTRSRVPRGTEVDVRALDGVGAGPGRSAREMLTTVLAANRQAGAKPLNSPSQVLCRML